MYRYSYAEILEDSSETTRSREQMALDHAIDLLTIAEAKGSHSPEAQDAIQFVQKLWNFLIEDLVSPNNALAEALRADLVAVGIWIIREADRILIEPARTMRALIEVNTSIRDGLK